MPFIPDSSNTDTAAPVNTNVVSGQGRFVPDSDNTDAGDSSSKPTPSAMDYYVKNPAISAGKAYLNDAKDIGNAISHPIDALKGVGNALLHPVDTVVNTVKNLPDTIMNHPIQTATMALPGAEGAMGAGIDAVKAVPDVLKDTSGRIGNMMVKLPDKAMSYGKQSMKVMADEKIPGNSITDYAKNANDRLNQRVSQLNQQVSKSKSVVNLDNDINRHIDSASSSAGNSLQDRTDLQNKLDEMKQRIYTQYGSQDGTLDNMSLQKAVQLKRQLADDFPFSPMETKSSTNNLLATAAHQIHHSINNAIDDVAPGVSQLNDRVSSLIDISQAAKKRVAAESRSNPLGFIGTLMGVGGLVAHGVVGGAEGIGAALALKAASSPFVLTRVANGLSSLSDAMKNDLFKEAPWFENVAKKSEAYAPEAAKGLPPPPSSKGGEVNAELVQKAMVTPAPYKSPSITGPNVAKGLPEPLSQTSRVGINTPDKSLPSPRVAGQSSGPIINQGSSYKKPPADRAYPQTDFGHQIKYQMQQKESVPLHPAEEGRAELSKIYPPAEKGNPNLASGDIKDFNDMKDWELSQNAGGVKSWGGTQNNPDRTTISSASGHSDAFKKVSGNSEKVGFDLLKRASNGQEMSPGEQLKIKMMIQDFRKNIKPNLS